MADVARTRPEAGYEATDASPRGILAVGAFAVSVIIVIFLSARWVFVVEERRASVDHPPRNAYPRDAEVPPPPQLQLNPRLDLGELRRENRETLTGVGWMDRAHGWVRIPIEDAMTLLQEQRKGRAKKP